MYVGQVAALTRYPVKSMAGEHLDLAHVTERGLAGDRCWATYTPDGGIGSGKTTRRFRRVDGLPDLRARLDDPPGRTAPSDVPGVAGGVPLVVFPDGQERRADAPETSAALSALLGQPLLLAPETSVPHHDESPVHLVTTAALRHVSRSLGDPVDAARFRANIVVDVEGVGFVEDDWQGRQLALGEEVVLRLGAAMIRCVMVDMAQPHEGLPGDARLLKALGESHDVEFGLQASVVRSGRLWVGDAAMLL